MPLPIAQLGYMPNLNVPTQVQRYPYKNPWTQLAETVLAAAGQQGVSNLMQPDFAGQAAQQNLTGDAGTVSADPMTDPTTGQSFGGGGTLAPTEQPWWKKAVQGPQVSRQQLEQLQAQKSETGRTKLQTGSAERQTHERAQTERDVAAAAQAGETFRQGQQISRLGEPGLGLQRQIEEARVGIEEARVGIEEARVGIQGREAGVQERMAGVAEHPPVRPDTLQTTGATMADTLYRTRMEVWQQQRQRATFQAMRPDGSVDPVKLQTLVGPPPAYDEAVRDAFNAAQKYMGLSAPPSVTAPSVPLVGENH